MPDYMDYAARFLSIVNIFFCIVLKPYSSRHVRRVVTGNVTIHIINKNKTVMKKTILAIAAAMMMSANVMAQGNEQRPQMDPAEMMKARTEQMVKDYGLNEEQAKQVGELNQKYAGKIPMMRGGQRGQRPQGQQGEGQRPQRQQGDNTRRGERPQGQQGQMNFEEMRKNMEEYNAELQKIMTEEQFKKYTENNQRRGQRGGNGGGFGGGQRPQRNNF